LNRESSKTHEPTKLDENEIIQSIEALPIGPFHHRFILLISLGMWFDFFDIFSMAYIGAALQSSHFLTLDQYGWLVSALFLGMFAGTIVFGMGSDRMGRRSAFLCMLLIYSGFSMAGALAPTPLWLIGFRFFAGVGVGAENVVVDTYVAEMTPSRNRGRYVAITQVVGFTAVPVSALLSRWLVPTHFLMSGWRWVMVIGSLGALWTWYLRRNLPESPRWLLSRQRHEAARQALAQITGRGITGGGMTGQCRPGSLEGAGSPRNSSGREIRSSARAEGALLSSQAGTKERQHDLAKRPGAGGTDRTGRPSFSELWRPPYRSRMVMLVIFHALQTLGFYGFSNWAPTFLVSKGITLIKSLDYTLFIAAMSPIGPVLGALTADRMERKWTLVVLALLVGGLGLTFSFSSSGPEIITTGGLVTISAYWFSAVFHAYQGELFPTKLRATGVGFTYSWSRLSAAFSSILIARLLSHGVPAVFLMISTAMAGVAAIVALLGPRTNRRQLEELSG
jgi:putative MFS transporter